MTYTNQPAVNVFQYTIAEEDLMEALSMEAEANHGSYAYHGEDTHLVPADLVVDPDQGHTYIYGGFSRWQGGQDEDQW